MSADPSALQKAMFDRDDDGPDGIVLASWGFTAVLAFVFAYAAWQYGSATLSGLAPLPPSGEVEITGSVETPVPDIGTFGKGKSRPDQKFAPEVTTIEVDVLRREVGELRRSFETLRQLNDRLTKRIAALEADATDITGSIPKSPGMPATSRPAPVPSAGVTVTTRAFEPGKDLPAVKAAPGKSDAMAAGNTPAKPVTTTSLETVTGKPASQSVRIVEPEASTEPPVKKPNAIALITTIPDPPTKAGRETPAQPAPVVMRDGKLPIDAELPGIDDPVITGSIPNAAARKIVPPSKPRGDAAPKPVSLPRTIKPGAVSGDDDASSGQLTKSTFGIDLGGFRSFKDLQKNWTEIQSKNAVAIGELKPLASMSERDGALEARLIAGPFDNAANAMKLCAQLMAKGVACQPALYTGQPFTGP